ncbi:protein SCO1 [Janthinobacterium sp. CG_23.3]
MAGCRIWLRRAKAVPVLWKRCAGLLCCWVAAAAGAAPASSPPQLFTAPAAGSYALQSIQPAPNGRVLDSAGGAADFARFSKGRVTLLSFIYTYCSDPLGCPLAYAIMHDLRQRLLAQPALARRVRFVSLSFDPVNDTPEAMRRYAGRLADVGNTLQWHFLTTQSVQHLKPLVDGLGQSVQVQLDSRGRPGRLFSHMLKVFLLDARGEVREIYSTAFLQPDVMFNDIETLLMEQDRAGRKRLAAARRWQTKQ